MTLMVQNTISGKLEEFVPVKEGQVGMYVCGINTYDDSHMGHAKAAVTFDIIRRHVEKKGYDVKYVINFTDIEDHCIERAIKLGWPLDKLTDKYIDGIPTGSRASKAHSYLKPDAITPEKIAQICQLNDLAKTRGQSLAQMAVTWTLRDPAVTSALIGASRVSQIEEIVASLDQPPLSAEELGQIDKILASGL